MYHYIIDQTINARLNRADESIVLRLLNVADPKTGKVALLMDDFLHLCDLRSKGAATRYLCTLKQAGIINYQTNSYRMDAQVFVDFLGWGVEAEKKVEKKVENGVENEVKIEAQVEELRAEVQEIRRLLVENCALKSARGDAENGEKGAQILTESRAVFIQQTDKQTEQTEDVNLLVCNRSTEIQEQTNKQTKRQTETARVKERAESSVDAQKNEPQIKADGRGLGEEQERTFKLLTEPEIGMGEQKAREIAQRHRFAYIRRHTFAWLAEMKSGDVRGVGALVHRINYRFGAAEPTDEQQRSELYQRYRTAFEIEAEAKVKEEYASMLAPAPPPKSQPRPTLEPVAPDLWSQVLAKLHKEFGDGWIFTEFVQPARLLGVREGVYIIGLPDERLSLQAQQYKGIIRRTLGGLVGNYQVPVAIETIEAKQENRRLQAGIYEMCC